MKTPEGYEKDDICRYLDSIEAWYFRHYAAGYGKSGQPDLVCCIDGCFVGIEVKREGKKPTKLQEERMRQINMAGGRAFWGTAGKVIPEIKSWLAQPETHMAKRPQ